jgi:hypothetical protein
MKTVKLNGTSDFNSTEYYIHHETETFAIINNGTCLADCESLLADYLGIHKDGLFNPKHLRPECKSHLSIINKYNN